MFLDLDLDVSFWDSAPHNPVDLQTPALEVISTLPPYYAHNPHYASDRISSKISDLAEHRIFCQKPNLISGRIFKRKRPDNLIRSFLLQM